MAKSFTNKYSMAKSYFNIEIERTNGPYPRNRYGIILKPLMKLYRKLLVEHRHIREWSQDDQFIHCVLRMQRPAVKNSRMLKTYFDWESNTPVTRDELTKTCNEVDWFCAISMKPIRAIFNNFDLKNFLHEEYYDVLDAPMVDSRLLKSSIEFRHKCKKLLLDEREEFLKLAKKNAGRSL
ncbi:hypothetical protein N9P49_00010 [bacterium]|nr:hypothetical protein [bacterium]|tara:strand:- start:126 stop:665 length:540 start_codon:yes stop_codon:yes gene_type:complete